MRFREWLQLDEIRWKGLHRQYKQMHPQSPRFVTNQMYKATIQPNVQKSIMPWLAKSQQEPFDHTSPTMVINPSTPRQERPRIPETDLPQGIIGKTVAERDFLKGVQFSKKPQTVTLRLPMFDEQTLAGLRWCAFGLRPNDNFIRNDTRRFDAHRKLALTRGEAENEPIILVRDNTGKYQILDGYHRVSAYFLKVAPPEYIEDMRKGDFTNVDFNRWKPVTINAYIGVMPTTPNSTQHVGYGGDSHSPTIKYDNVD